jgi:hypothetical protein
MAKRKSCKLCTVKRKQWENEDFFGVNCRKHFVPIIVIKSHKKRLNLDEKDQVKVLIEKYHKGMFPDKSLSDSDEHWHLHLTKKDRGIKI